jgi:tRNA(Glu) U13 pseudouridine synthase TruD
MRSSMLFNQKAETEYDRPIRRVLREMETVEPKSKEFNDLTDRLQKLQKMRSDDRPDPINRNTILQVAAHLVGMTMIIHYEQLGVITTKALSFVPKAK